MFDQKHAVWQRDTCQISNHIAIRVWNSDRQPKTWRVFLLWQPAPGKPRQKLYTRYFTADDKYAARKGAFPIIRRWLFKQTKHPEAITESDWKDILEHFGLTLPERSET